MPCESSWVPTYKTTRTVPAVRRPCVSAWVRLSPTLSAALVNVDAVDGPDAGAARAEAGMSVVLGARGASVERAPFLPRVPAATRSAFCFERRRG